MTFSFRLLLTVLCFFFLETLQAQTKTIKIRKIDSTRVELTLAGIDSGTITVDQLLADPFLRSQGKGITTITACETVLFINGKIKVFESQICSELSPEQILLIKTAKPSYNNRIEVNAKVRDWRGLLNFRTVYLKIKV